MQDTPKDAATGMGMVSMRDLLTRVNNSDIATLRHNVLRILSLVHNPATTARELSDLIETDPPLCSRILRVANSAYYGSQRHIGAIREAIIWLGFNTVKELALSQKVCELFERNGILADFSLRDLWHHSLLVAVCAKMIYRREFGIGGEEAYTAGLLHEIGLIIEAQFCQEPFAQTVHRVGEGNLRLVEREVLGYDHCEVGGAVAQDWGFPVFLVQSIQYHHDPQNTPEVNRRLAQTVYIADMLTHGIHPQFEDEPVRNDDVFTSCMQDLRIETEALELLGKELEKERQILIEKGLLA